MREKFKPDTETGVRRGRTRPHHIPILVHVLGNSASRGPRNNLPQVHFAHKALAHKSANLLAEILKVRGQFILARLPYKPLCGVLLRI